MARKIFTTRRLISTINKIERDNKRQAKYDAQQSFIEEAESMQNKLRDHYSLYTDLLAQNLLLDSLFIEKYVEDIYENQVERTGFWNRFFKGKGPDADLVSLKKQEIVDNYKNKNIDDYINAVFWSLKTPTDKILDGIEFVLQNKTLVFNQALLDISQSLDYKDITYTSKKVKYVNFKKGEKKELFLQYYNQVALAAVNLLFQSDTENHLEEIVYNGWVDTQDKRTGEQKNVCVVSLSVNREEFEKLRLEYVDPIECMKFLHGRVDTDIDSFSVEGVKPFLQFDADKKIIQADSIIDEIQSNNLMDLTWEEFEIYVRDWLKKEFENARVEVTQSSRDGGIDAIIYDDDFLKGGVTIVQVKQYNITVPVSAVRDLYGVMNDRRASRGILVTTSDFGTDSRKFVKDKSISLVNGANLLYYLKNQGHNVEIKKK